MARPKACSICVFTELCGQHKQDVSAAPAYIPSNKPACCSIGIVKEILVCASDLNNVLFAFVMFKTYISFLHLFLSEKRHWTR